MREFISVGNESVIKSYNIADMKSQFTIMNAHTDNIKRALYVDENFILSGSSDKTVKLWDVRNYSQALSTIKLN